MHPHPYNSEKEKYKINYKIKAKAKPSIQHPPINFSNILKPVLITSVTTIDLGVNAIENDIIWLATRACML